MTEFFEKYLEEGIKDHTMFICIAVVFVIGSSIVILFGKEEEIDSMKPALTMETVMKAPAVMKRAIRILSAMLGGICGEVTA